MKKCLKLIVLALFVGFSSACDDSSEPYVEPQLEVTPNNLAGSWQLVAYDGEVALGEQSYLYINFVRKDRTFTMYDNLESFTTRVTTGSYNITTDEELGAILRGNYDYGVGDWNHRYVVKSLTATAMTWVAQDNPALISTYVRCEIPSEILEQAGEE